MDKHASPSSQHGPSPDAEPRDSLFGLTAREWEKGWHEALMMAAVSLAKQAQAKRDRES